MEWTDEQAESLAMKVAERASRLAREGELKEAEEEKRIASAVARAVKDAQIDRDLAEHGEHLLEINGSQRQMAASLAKVEATQERQTVAQEAIADYIGARGGRMFTRWQVALGLLMAVAAFGGLAIAVFASAPHG